MTNSWRLLPLRSIYSSCKCCIISHEIQSDGRVCVLGRIHFGSGWWNSNYKEEVKSKWWEISISVPLHMIIAVALYTWGIQDNIYRAILVTYSVGKSRRSLWLQAHIPSLSWHGHHSCTVYLVSALSQKTRIHWDLSPAQLVCLWTDPPDCLLCIPPIGRVGKFGFMRCLQIKLYIIGHFKSGILC